jgi:hypothetical protein
MKTAAHPERLAWDGARALVHCAQAAPAHNWLLERLAAVLPPEYTQLYLYTRNRLAAPDRADAESVEAGVWRVRFEELLRVRPELAPPLEDIFHEARARLRDARLRDAGRPSIDWSR